MVTPENAQPYQLPSIEFTRRGHLRLHQDTALDIQRSYPIDFLWHDLTNFQKTPLRTILLRSGFSRIEDIEYVDKLGLLAQVLHLSTEKLAELRKRVKVYRVKEQEFLQDAQSYLDNLDVTLNGQPSASPLDANTPNPDESS